MDKISLLPNNRRGAIAPLAALLLPVLLLLSAMAVNLAYVQQCQTELDIATDSAARASSRIFSTTGDKSKAIAAAKKAGELNFVAGKAMDFLDENIVFGMSARSSVADRYDFQANLTPSNAVQVNGALDSTNGGVATFLPAIVGRDFLSITSNAVSTRIEVDLAVSLTGLDRWPTPMTSQRFTRPSQLRHPPVGILATMCHPTHVGWI